MDDARALGEEYDVADLCDALTMRLDAENAQSLVICILADTDPPLPVRESLTRLLELDDVALAARAYIARQYAPYLARAPREPKRVDRVIDAGSPPSSQEQSAQATHGGRRG